MLPVLHPGDGASDAELVARVRQGDRGAFDTLMTRHAGVLLRIAYGYLKSKADAEDVVQDVLYTVWQGRATWSPQGTAVSYLAVAVRRRALNVLKHRQIESRYEERVVAAAADDAETTNAPPPDVVAIAAEEQTSAWQVLEALPERAKLVLLLRYGQQLSFAEVAAVMGISAATSRQIAKRALDQLRAVYRV